MQKNTKIKRIDELVEIISFHRDRYDKKIVHCHGVFDMLHIGHIRHLEQAKKLGDVLVVTITTDKYVNKGPHRPVFNEELRLEAVSALECVDFVAINHWPTAVETIQRLRPNVYVKGLEYRDAEGDRTGAIVLEENAVKSVGGMIAFTDDITFSSSKLINEYSEVFSDELKDYLRHFSARYRAKDVLQYLESSKSLRTLVLGETIIDEYHYCESMGKSGKDPILAARYIQMEKFAGGVLAVANHVAAFSDHVGLLSFLGKTDSQENFVREKLNTKIQQNFLYMEDSPTIVKRRFVETYPLQKLFEVYIMNGAEGNGDMSQELQTKLKKLLPEYDLVIVTDYGHGMIDSKAVDILCDQARFLAVNTQLNADNRGYNTISKYHRADYICISENEIRLEARTRTRDLRDIVLETGERMSCDSIFITRGSQGCLCFSKDEGFFEIPAFSGRVIDRMGAGDAVFSVTAMCAARNAPVEVTGFIGSAVGAQAVGYVGNKCTTERMQLIRHIECLLK